jgi:putative transposase
MKHYAEKYLVFIAAYCLMPNHYHLLVRQEPGGSISRCIQTTFNAYSQTINLQTGHSGTLFQGKAKSKLIDSDDYLLDLIRYLHLNPVRTGFIDKIGDWPFSDYIEWIGKRTYNLKKEEFQRQFFLDGTEYESFVDEYKEELDRQKIEKYLL